MHLIDDQCLTKFSNPIPVAASRVSQKILEIRFCYFCIWSMCCNSSLCRRISSCHYWCCSNGANGGVCVCVCVYNMGMRVLEMGTEVMLVIRTDVLKKPENWNWIHNCLSQIKLQSKEPPINPCEVLSWKQQIHQVFEILELEGFFAVWKFPPKHSNRKVLTKCRRPTQQLSMYSLQGSFSDENWWLGPQTNRQTRRW